MKNIAAYRKYINGVFSLWRNYRVKLFFHQPGVGSGKSLTMYMYIKCVLLLCAFITSGGDALTLIEVGGAASTPVVAPVEDTPTTKGEVPKDQMDDLEFWLADAKVQGSKKSEAVLKKAELSTKTESPETKHKVRRCAEGREGEEGNIEGGTGTKM